MQRRSEIFEGRRHVTNFHLGLARRRRGASEDLARGIGGHHEDREGALVMACDAREVLGANGHEVGGPRPRLSAEVGGSEVEAVERDEAVARESETPEGQDILRACREVT